MNRRALLLSLSVAALAKAGEAVIEPGREGEVLALLACGSGAKSPRAGSCGTCGSAPARWVVELTAGPNEAAQITLSERAGAAEHSASFDLRRDTNAATDALVAAIRNNDRGGFWRTPAAHPAPIASHARGTAWSPVGVALAVSAAMLWVARARRRR